MSYQSKLQNDQINKLVYLNKMKAIASAHEDHNIRFFDPSSGTILNM